MSSWVVKCLYTNSTEWTVQAGQTGQTPSYGLLSGSDYTHDVLQLLDWLPCVLNYHVVLHERLVHMLCIYSY